MSTCVKEFQVSSSIFSTVFSKSKPVSTLPLLPETDALLSEFQLTPLLPWETSVPTFTVTSSFPPKRM